MQIVTATFAIHECKIPLLWIMIMQHWSHFFPNPDLATGVVTLPNPGAPLNGIPHFQPLDDDQCLPCVHYVTQPGNHIPLPHPYIVHMYAPTLPLCDLDAIAERSNTSSELSSMKRFPKR